MQNHCHFGGKIYELPISNFIQQKKFTLDFMYTANFNGWNTFESMKIYQRQGLFDLVSVNHSTRSGDIFSIFFNVKVHYVFSLESPRF